MSPVNRRSCLQRAALGCLAWGLPQASWSQGSATTFNPRDLDHARELMQQALVSDVAWRLLQELAVGIGPRPAGSEGDRRAVAWAQGALRELGLQQVRTQAMELKVWQRGKGSAQLLGRSLSDASGPRQAGAPHELVMAALGNSISTPEGGVEAEVAWYPVWPP